MEKGEKVRNWISTNAHRISLMSLIACIYMNVKIWYHTFLYLLTCLNIVKWTSIFHWIKYTTITWNIFSLLNLYILSFYVQERIQNYCIQQCSCYTRQKYQNFTFSRQSLGFWLVATLTMHQARMKLERYDVSLSNVFPISDIILRA